MRKVLLIGLVVALSGCSAGRLVQDAAIDCNSCVAWNEPHEPVQIAENTWYVGTAGLSSILIATSDGLILLDGALPQSAPLIAENIESLGYSLRDIELIGLSHAHYDHSGGIAALARASRARVVALAPQAEALRLGRVTPDDPQYPSRPFPAVEQVEVIEDGWSVRMGYIRLTAVATPGHTPGGTSWLWNDCIGEECYDIAYVDSLTPISAQGFRFSNGIGDVLRQTTEIVADLECEIFLAPHPGRFGFADGPPFINPDGCGDYAASTNERLDERLAEEASD
ncbi:MAG: subclass B3 metallo-beta-lactamase [Woeseiaceae bacterium]|nr:subclass B3 metallo-beta-lactamase [Woeseiaceae bacterium]